LQHQDTVDRLESLQALKATLDKDYAKARQEAAVCGQEGLVNHWRALMQIRLPV
jgi:hypothetical protein